ncbi:MAG TPA: MotA/TolQ/ExbB proton channel family protein [Candidatus Krumholzibacteriaceae bacterium]|nr:MotA/TolQ/ExbB proton channel family protein [Candidatus Krumholzibacteriaceae bacterium]
MGFEGIPIFLQIAGNFVELISRAGVLAKLVLALLLVLSVVSWTIIVEKIRYFRLSSKEGGEFRKLFKDELSLRALIEKAKEYPASCEAQLVLSIGNEITSGELGSLKSLDRFLESKIDSIIAGWESYLIFLSTTATISPFLGLLGTVWGIMRSFISMGARGSADLYVVGPGIAEALITTIFGLGAAIPAVIGYNYMVRLIRRKEDDLTSFMVLFRSRLTEGKYGELRRDKD